MLPVCTQVVAAHTADNVPNVLQSHDSSAEKSISRLIKMATLTGKWYAIPLL
ncbi:Hypothetical protein FKW44_020193 [Caligus rogercresseyi]|uniref:Uncharacterized protein n=1 Tax=Caligus rogercresseyi TaxID=217165 RepID=A0A7T8GX71_CALRO|nr:Hypothetical protein FKW44_020193 [Caligus rogercresseyi]